MIAKAEDWECLPFGEMTKIPYQAIFDEQQFEKLTSGLIPEAMEHKWFIYFNEDDRSLCYHRSWTGLGVFRLLLQREAKGAHSVQQAFCSLNECKQFGGERYSAEILDFVTSNLLLGQAKPFPLPAGYGGKVPGALQHHIAGTGYREAAASDRAGEGLP